MILVAGATGLLGSDVCVRLRRSGQQVRALVRPSANKDRLDMLRSVGVDFAWGDLKDAASLSGACTGVQGIVYTASSTFSRQERDSIETVDRQGTLAMIEAARQAGVGQFTFVSIPRTPVRESPLTRAKSTAEQALTKSGIPYTILAANFFMEVWLSPAVGFDHVNRSVVIFGDGRQPLSWISSGDVAEFAVRSLHTPEARSKTLDIGGPEDLSPNEVVRICVEVGVRNGLGLRADLDARADRLRVERSRQQSGAAQEQCFVPANGSALHGVRLRER